MAIDKNDVRKRLFGNIPAFFMDPVTGLKPASEIELSSLLCVFHQKGLVQWDRVKLYGVNYEPSKNKADSLFSQSSMMTCEWPLFASNEEQTNIWGQMTADLAYISEDNDTVVLIENKIGSGFTSEGSDVENGQLARQIKYLIRSKITNKYIMLLSSKEFFEAGWYLNELCNTLSHRNRDAMVKSYLICWEEIFSSIRID